MFASGAAIIIFADVPASINLGYKGGVNTDYGAVVLAVFLQVGIEIIVDCLCCGYESNVGIIPLEVQCSVVEFRFSVRIQHQGDMFPSISRSRSVNLRITYHVCGYYVHIHVAKLFCVPALHVVHSRVGIEFLASRIQSGSSQMPERA